MNYLLDTCVISEFTTKQPDQKVIEWIDSVDDSRLFLSALTIGEIQHGIAKLPESRKRRDLEKWLNDELLVRFDGRILPLTVDVFLTWGNLVAKTRPLPAMDSMIVALALHHDACLVTRNVKDFDGTDVEIVNPWDESK